MTKLTDNLKRMLNALASADAGEGLTLRQKTRYLNRDAVPVAAAEEQIAPVKMRQQVALYMGSELPAEIMQYVIQTCSRLKHGLTVLTFQTDSVARSLLDPHASALEDAGIAMQVVTLSGDPVSGLARYLRRHSEVAFLACNETGYLGRSFLNGTQRQDVLPVPVVLVAPNGAKMQDVDPSLSGAITSSARAA